MIGKRVSSPKRTLATIALMATLVWLTACTATTSTGTPSTASSTSTATDVATAETTSETTPTAGTTGEAAETEQSGIGTAETGIVKLNLNTATAADFLTIPNVGDRMVHEFEEYRPYISIQQFRREIGKYVDEAQVAAYEEYVYVPIMPNEADSETLQQLPGVTPEIADALIAARPYDSTAAFLEALTTHVTPEELAVGESYVESE